MCRDGVFLEVKACAVTVKMLDLHCNWSGCSQQSELDAKKHELIAT